MGKGKKKKKKSLLIPTVKESFETGKTQGMKEVLLEAIEMTKQNNMDYIKAYLRSKLSTIDPVFGFNEKRRP